jgi:Zn-dependent protease with chaperone function
MGASVAFVLLLVAGIAGGGALYGILLRVCQWAGILCAQATESLCRLLQVSSLPGDAALAAVAVAAAVTLPGLCRLGCGTLCVSRAVRRAATIRRQASHLPAQVGAAAARAGLAGRLVLVSGAGDMAFTSGLWRPRVYVGEGLLARLAPAELEAVLLHEATHVRQRDPLRIALGDLVSTLLWFLPALRDLQAHLALQLEVEADQEAISQVGRQPLAGALYTLMAAVPTAVPGVAAAALMTEARLRALLDGAAVKPRLGVSRLVLSGVSTVIMTCLLVL